jgi:chromosome segregation protein
LGRVETLAARRIALEVCRAALDVEVEREEMRGLLSAARRRGGRLVAEGLEVDPDLRAAVEGALGPALAAAALPRTRVAELHGRPGHIVLDDGRRPIPAPDAERAVREAAAAGGGPLGAAIRRDPQGLISALLASTVWLPDLASALTVAPALPAGWQAVTREGEVVRADGLVRLGPPAAVLARRAERETLAAELAELALEEARAQASLAETTRGLEAATALEAQAQVALEAAHQVLRGLEAQGRQATGAAELEGRERAWADAQAARLEGEAERARAALAAAAPASADGPSERRQVTSETGTPDALAGWRARLASLEARRAGLMAERAEREEATAATADRRRRAELAISGEEERLVAQQRRESELAEAEATLEAVRASSAVDLAAARQAEADAQAALHELDVDELADRERLAAAEREAVDAREQLRRAEEGARTAELAALEARLGLDTVREQLLVELAGLGELGLAALAPAEGGQVIAEDGDDGAREAAIALQLEAGLDSALRAWAESPAPGDAARGEVPGPARLATLRRRYHEVGASNPFAAEEYAEVKVRLEDLEAQQQDLDRAIVATRALIAELNERITTQFRNTFAALEGAFARRFEQLFGGGEAQLVLTDPDDLASTGVEIMARPPGKKRQALAMLSGGERALTAVALLFSMLDVRPVPFCVLDEVDAALDEANITRFTEALRELAVGTQFVIITHNRGTIEAADALYGITIGDDAVSRVISLRLAEATVLAQAVG